MAGEKEKKNEVFGAYEGKGLYQDETGEDDLGEDPSLMGEDDDLDDTPDNAGHHYMSEMTDDEIMDEEKEERRREKLKQQGKAPKEKKKKKKSTIILDILILLLAGVLVFSGYHLVKTFREYRESQEAQDKVSEIFHAGQTGNSSTSTGGSGDSGTSGTAENEFTEYYTLTPLVAQNSDTVGWIKIPGTKVDYAVMQGRTNDSYLRTDFFGNWSIGGTPFMDYRNDIGGELQNYIIYGHRMDNGSMFTDLIKFPDQDYYDEHKTFTLLLREGDYDVLYDCEIFSAYRLTTDTDAWITSFSSKEDYEDYLYDAVHRSYIQTDVTVTADDQIVTLSTCDYTLSASNGRVLVLAKMTPRVKTPIDGGPSIELSSEEAQ